ncbi:MAG: penicillin acylase family protein, partial [Candidatus Korobacteraceae bacterium]
MVTIKAPMEAIAISPPARTSSRKLIFRAVVAVLLLLLIAFVAFDVWFYRAVRAALPQVDGTIHLAGLTGPVSVTYDSLCVPHIATANLPDLLFAQGYITAQDRLWQMDMTRRYAAGELSAVLGPEYIKIDREQRILGLRQVAERAVANMTPAQKAQFEAYAAGVNAYIAQHQKTLPMEFRFLTYFPHVWTAEDSTLVGLSMVEFLNHYLYKQKLFKEKVLARLGPELTADLYVNSSWRDHPPGAEGASIENEIPTQTTPDEGEDPGLRRGKKISRLTSKEIKTQIPRLAALAGDEKHGEQPGVAVFNKLKAASEGLSLQPESADDHLQPGSNNWVVSGAHTVSGKPLLSNDMHLDLQIPNVWYEAHLTAGDFDVAGVTLPGVPFVIVGHNRRIAWGFTNLGLNVEDVYIEKFNDKGEYLTPQGWVKPEHRKEIIEVKGKPEVNLDVVITRHGPIITDIVPGEQRPLALKWVIYDPSVGSLVFFDVDSARNWQEFRAAFSRFGAPGQNVVYADVEGHIGYLATGAIPIRADGDGSLPVAGDDDSHEWTGYVPSEQLPNVYDPPSGIIATANGRITPDGYPYLLSIEWMAPYRTERIYKLLNARKKFTPPDMLAIQVDI